MDNSPETSRTYLIARMALFVALTTVATLVIRIPIPATKGYFNLGDSLIFTSALLFGANMGAVAGGLGSALADILGGYSYWAPLTLVIKGIEGYVVGRIARGGGTTREFRITSLTILGVLTGGICMVLGYFISEIILYGLGAALAELIPNVFQAVGGLAIALPLTIALRKAGIGVRS